MATLSHITRGGLPGIDRIPFGMHACHFYSDYDQLVAALVPYFVAGLRGNERCLWITAPPLPAREAVQTLRAAWPGVEDTIEAGALRVLDFDRWYGSAARLKGLDMVELWLAEEERALADGYSGLRLAGNTSFVTSGDWSTFMEFEEAVTAHFSSRRIVTLCSYALEQCDDQQVGEAMRAHHCALERGNTHWQVVPASFPRGPHQAPHFRRYPLNGRQRKGGGNMNNGPEKHIMVTCRGCGKINSITLFNPSAIRPEEVVLCSKCSSIIGSWGVLARQ